MTTIILTVLSIMLAAAAALVVVFWGGDMYSDGGVSARADTYINAGENVAAAADQFRMENRRDPADLAALTSSGFLSRLPDPARSTLAPEGMGVRFSVTGVPADVCDRINETTKSSGRFACRMDGATGTYSILT